VLGEIASGEFSMKVAEWHWLTWVILIIKLFLIALLIWLIKVQRDLKCELKEPTGCVKEKSNIPAGKLYVVVKGTASGAAFGSYKLEVNQGTDPPFTDIVSYPGGGASGSTPVVDDKLGEINTLTLEDGEYTITLTVYPAGPGTPKVCTINFHLLKVAVLMNLVGEIEAISMAPVADNPNPLDPAAELRKDFAASPPPHDYQPVSVGGNITIDGMAYVYGCTDRKIVRYEIRYARVTAPGGEPSQPSNLTPIPATWPPLNQIVAIDYSTPDHYQWWTKLGPGPTNLIKKWGFLEWGGKTYFYLKDAKWNSSGIASGRYSFLLTVEDSISMAYHDIQHVWLDNEPVFALITGIKDVSPCVELALSQFVSTGMDILGIAWDRLIDDAFPDTAPNDNFGHYTLTLYKQGVTTPHTIGTFNSRVIVPFRKSGATPDPSEEGTLANFDIATVIDDDNPGKDPNVSIPRKTGCGYYLRLDVYDKTRLNDDNHVHHSHSIWPFCIVNDLKGKP
jgi:hypothetical protein